MILPLCSTLVREHVDLLEQVQRRTTEMIRGLEQLFYTDRLRELVLFSKGSREILLQPFNTKRGPTKKGVEKYRGFYHGL